MTSIGGWTIHLQAALRYDSIGYSQPAAIYNVPEVVYGADPYAAQWVTIDCQVTKVTASHGGKVDQTPGVRADLGTLSASLHDPTRQLDPAASPFRLLTTPNVPVRLVAVSPLGVIVPIWTGVADSWTHDYLDGSGELKASDYVSLFTGIKVTNWKRPNETSRDRYQAVMALLPGTVPFVFEGVNASLSAATFSGDLWQAVIATTSEAEQSIVWLDQYGRFRRRDTMGMPPPIHVRDCDDGLAAIVYTRLGSSYDDDTLTNVVLMERLNIGQTDRAPRQVANQTSINKYASHSLSNTQLALLDDTALTNWGNRVLDLRAFPVVGPTGMGILLQNNFPWTVRTVGQAATLEVGDILDISLTSKGQQEKWLAAIAGLTHSISTTAWDVSVELVDGPRYAENAGYNHASSIYNVTKYGRIPGVSPVGVSA